MASRFTELCIDCSNPESLAKFWCEVLDYKITDNDDDEVARANQAPAFSLCAFRRRSR
jgi:hypothetical protein